MEAIRPEQSQQYQSNDSLIDLADALPPPPAPFPAYQALQNGHAIAPTEITEQELSALQSTCIAALASLLPSEDASSHPTLAERDRPLAAALTELLETTYELESFSPSPAYEEVAGLSTAPQAPDVSQVRGNEASFAALAQHLGSLRSGAGGGVARSRESLQPAIDVYRQEVARERVQTLSRVVLGMVRARESDEAVSAQVGNGDRRAPEYQVNEKTADDLPDYEESADVVESKDKKAEAGPSSPRPATSEKMMHDLDNLTSAIERLSSLAPQYADQRSVLRPVRPRSASPIRTTNVSTKGKGKAERQLSDKAKMKELEDIWRQIERSHGRRRMRDDQRVDMEGVQSRRMEGRGQFLEELYERAEMSRMKGQDGVMRAVDGDLARARELRDRDRFLRELLEVSAGARMDDQDASAPDQQTAMTRNIQARNAFVQDLMGRMQSGRLDTQDYPISPETRIHEQRQHLFDSLVSFSSSGRMADQDSAPPTPRPRDVAGLENPNELVTMETFFKDGPPPPDVARRGRMRPSSAGALGTEKVGTFGKLKGALRRRSVMSLSMGLKAAKEPDFSQANYIVEHQENLNIVTVTLFGPHLPLNSDLQLKSFDPASCSLPAVEAILQKDDLSLRIPMPVPILSHQSVPLTAHGLHLEAKLASVPVASFAPTLISSVSHPLSASELRELDPRGICCTACDREIASLPSSGAEKDQRFKDLPSEYWAEMMEVWMCHDDPGFTARLASQTKEGFWPTKGKVLVGGSYLLVNPGDIKRGTIVQETSKDISWDVVSCLCGEVLGKARKEDDKPGAGTLRLSKWAIALLQDDDVDGESVEPTRYPLGVYVTSDMLDLAQAHATFRFLIVDEENEWQRILIWLFNPSVRISYRHSPSAPLSPLRNTHPTPKSTPRSRRSSGASTISRADNETNGATTPTTLRACKIMYRHLPPGAAEAATQGQGQVEELKYPSLVVERLLAVLEASTAVYPEGRRKMGVWDVGFLGRV